MMDKLKFTVILVVTLAVVIILGYWAIVTIEPASLSAEREKQEALEARNAELEAKIAELTEELDALRDEVPPEETPSETPTDTSSEHQALIGELQKLVDAGIYMKQGSNGTRVGTVQKFLNIYNNTSKTVDNDYGPGTKTDVLAFQKAEGLTADGEAGPNTFKKMIDWLKKN